MSQKVLLIGLDCADPRLVFDLWRDDLPNLNRLMAQGSYGRLRSCDPPITVPAWSSMMTSLDPGELGFYGFRNRADYSYDKMGLATSRQVPPRTVWDIIGNADKKSILLGVPQTFPPRPINGHMVTCFLTPSMQSQCTYPPELKAELEPAAGGEYIFDVSDFRSDDKQRILNDIYTMTERQCRVFRHLVQTKPWDFAMMVVMGTDRIHHGFWQYCFPDHPLYEPNNGLETCIHDYYVYVDQEIGKILAIIDDETLVLVVSDHGARGMDGGICVNEWLMQQGYLVLKEPPAGIIPLEKAQIDWSKTTAWAAGGYYARLYLNVAGREPEGIVPANQYEQLRDDIAAKLAALGDEHGNSIGTFSVKPQDLYRTVRNIAPDLIVYFGDLAWRSLGTIGHGVIHKFENDTGPDGANHDWYGLLIAHDPRNPQGGRRLEDRQLMDIAPSILRAFGLEPLADMQGTAINW